MPKMRNNRRQTKKKDEENRRRKRMANTKPKVLRGKRMDIAIDIETRGLGSNKENVILIP